MASQVRMKHSFTSHSSTCADSNPTLPRVAETVANAASNSCVDTASYQRSRPPRTKGDRRLIVGSMLLLLLLIGNPQLAHSLQAGGVEIGDLENGSVIGEPFQELSCPITAANPATFVGLEVTQSIQSMGMTNPSPTHPENNKVPLIAFKKTIARAYFDYIPPAPLLSTTCAITGQLTAFKNGVQVGVPVGPMHNAQLYYPQNGDLFAKRKTLWRSLNFELPQDWVAEGTLSLAVQLTGTGGLPVTCSGCSTQTGVTFQPPKPLRLRLIKLIEEDASGNPIGVQPLEADTGLIKSWLRRAFPIPNISGPPPALWDIPIVVDEWPVDIAVSSYVDFFGPIINYRNDAIANGMENRTRLVGLFVNGTRGWGGGTPNPNPAGSSRPDMPAVVPTGSTIPLSWPSSTSPGPPWDDDGSYADWYTGHELAHTFGFHHVEQCNEPPLYDPDIFDGSISDAQGTYFGFDVGHIGAPILGANMSKIKVQPLPGSNWHDLRTYCSYTWMSPQVYEKIRAILVNEDLVPVFTALRANNSSAENPREPCATPSDLDTSLCSRENFRFPTIGTGDYLAIVATLNLAKNEAQIQTSRVPRAEFQPVPEHPDVVIQLVDNNDEVVVQKNAVIDRMYHSRGSQDEQAILRDAIEVPQLPPHKGFKALRLFMIGDSQPIAEMVIPKDPPPTPTIKVHTIDSGQFAGGLEVSWKTTSNLGSTLLSYSIRISFDRGKRWQTLSAGRRSSRMVITSKRIGELRPRGATEAIIRVIATDGFNTSQQDQMVAIEKPDN